MLDFSVEKQYSVSCDQFSNLYKKILCDCHKIFNIFTFTEDNSIIVAYNRSYKPFRTSFIAIIEIIGLRTDPWRIPFSNFIIEVNAPLALTLKFLLDKILI